MNGSFGYICDEQAEPKLLIKTERAIQVIAELIMPRSYTNAEQIMSGLGGEQLLQWKRVGDWFTEPRYSDSDEPAFNAVDAMKVSQNSKQVIAHNLRQILTIMRRMKDVNSVPQYEHIINGFISTRNLIILGAETFY